MTGFEVADEMARGGTLALLALWSWLLLRDQRHADAARIAVAMNVAIAAHVLTTSPAQTFSPAADMLLDIVSVTVPALFWLFARAWFADERRIGPWGIASVLWLVLLVSLFYLWRGSDAALLPAVRIVLRASMLFFAGAGLWIAWRERNDDLVEARRRLRWRLAVAVGAYVILVNLVEVAVQLDRAPDTARSVAEFGVTALTFAFCVAMFGVRQQDLFSPPQRAEYEARSAPGDYADIVARLRAHMEYHKAWRTDGLTIAQLAAQLGEPEYRLRRAINGGLGHRNFAQFLNAYRLAEVREALSDPQQREVPILTVALDAGFGSLGPFNRAFREAEGMTPSAWREKALADSGIG